MPLAFSDIWEDQGLRFLIWEIEEPLDFFWQKLELPQAETDYINAIKVERRKLQSLSVRWLLQEQLGADALAHLQRDEFGRPFLIDSKWHVSFSHTHYLSAIALGTSRVGLDIQRFDARIPVFARKRFATEAELVLMQEDTTFEHLHVMWGLKEAMYKACGLRGVHFTNHMIAVPFVFQAQGGYIEARVEMPDQPIQLYRGAYFIRASHVVVMVAEQTIGL